jgi:hypothetical protein
MNNFFKLKLIVLIISYVYMENFILNFQKMLSNQNYFIDIFKKNLRKHKNFNFILIVQKNF